MSTSQVVRDLIPWVPCCNADDDDLDTAPLLVGV